MQLLFFMTVWPVWNLLATSISREPVQALYIFTEGANMNTSYRLAAPEFLIKSNKFPR